MRSTTSAPYDVLPSVRSILTHPEFAPFALAIGYHTLTMLVREALQALTADLPSTRDEAIAHILRHVRGRAQRLVLPRRQYLNATGIIVHTQWGNAPLSPGAVTRLSEASGASPTGAHEIGRRAETCERYLTLLTSAHAATVTTQNATSLVLAAAALACGREIVCAARDLIEISQGTRIADLLRAVGARVVPVGASNSVCLQDYTEAVTPATAFILRSYASNTITIGFERHVDLANLAILVANGPASPVPIVVNLGGGSLVDLTLQGLPSCPTLQDALGQGADLVLASGDKVIGGPQAGLIVGDRQLIHTLSTHPLARACRPGKLTLAALEATLDSYVRGCAWTEIPTLRLLAIHTDALRTRADQLAANARAMGLEADVRPDTTACGGAVLPGVTLPTWTIALQAPDLPEDALYQALLGSGLVGRRRDGVVLLDLRSVLPEQDELVVAALRAALAG